MASTARDPTNKQTSTDMNGAEHLIELGVPITHESAYFHNNTQLVNSLEKECSPHIGDLKEHIKVGTEAMDDQSEDSICSTSLGTILKERAELNELKLQELKLLQRRLSKEIKVKSTSGGEGIVKCECGIGKELGGMVSSNNLWGEISTYKHDEGMLLCL